MTPPPVNAAEAQVPGPPVLLDSTTERGVVSTSPPPAPEPAAVTDPAPEPIPVLPVTGSDHEPVGRDITRPARQLGATGDGTRHLVILGGLALLVGALAVALTGRAEPRPVPLTVSTVPGNRGRSRREPQPSRRRISNIPDILRPDTEAGPSGWEAGIRLAPSKRALARQRAGIGNPAGVSRSAWMNPDGGPGA